ncbi:MAG: sterol desaturase family protein, partial [Pseudomonadota bacterium]
QDSWRTVMAYNNRCSAAGTGCTRLQYFSNPNNTYGGDPMGISSTGPSNCTVGSTSPEPQTCAANNTSILNSNAASNSQFRISQITWTGANGTNWNDAANWEIIQGAANAVGGSTTTVNRVPLGIDDVVIPNGLGNYPTISSGSMVAREVVIENGATLNMTGGTLSVSGSRWEEQGHFPLVLMGFHPLLVLGAEILVQAYQAILHTEAIPKLHRWIENIFNTPSHHRVHHGSNSQYCDKNYAGIFIVWDKMFGTFEPEEEKVVYGITKPLNSVNPLVVFFHGFPRLWSEVRKSRSIGEFFGYLFKPPGWEPGKIVISKSEVVEKGA